jgi:O-antigen/teichoic acid export membrane protein
MTFARQSFGSLLALVFGILVSALLPRLLGAEARGEYQLAVKVAGLVLAVAQWGIPEVVLQLMADRQARPRALLGTSLALGTLGAIALIAILALTAPFFETNLLRGVDPFLLWLTLGGSLASMVGLLARRFIQLGGRLDIYNGLDVCRTLLFLAFIAALGLALPRQAVGATLAWLLGELALATAALAFVLHQLGRPKAPDAKLALQLVSKGAPIQFGLLGMFVGSEGGSFVLNAGLPLAAVGVYSVGLSVSRLVVQISIALRTALQPRLVTGEEDSAVVTARVTRHGLLWMVLLAIGLAIGSPLAPLVFTHEFDAVPPVIVLMLPGMVAYGVWQLLASHLLRLGRRSFLAVTAWLFGGLSIALQAYGTEAFGLVGAAAGLSVAYIVATVVVTVAFVRMSGIPVRQLVPSVADLAFYVHLVRRILASRQPGRGQVAVIPRD